MANEAILRIKVIADAAGAASGLDKAEQVGGKFGSAMRKAALPAAAAGAAILALGKKSLDAASDLQQANGAVEAVFGGQANAVKKASNAAAKTMGLSAAQYQNYAALVGTALQNAGMSVEDSVKASNDVMQRGADLSALYGGTTADAVEAINAAVARSEFDPLEKYGITLSATAINAELAAKGQDKLTGAALDTAKKQAALNLVMEKSSKAAGQYAREADSAAGSQQTATAQWENASAALGGVLLPLAAKFANTLADVATWAQRNATTVQILAGVFLALSVGVLAVNAALKVAAAGQAVFNGVMAIGNSLALGTRIQLMALTVAEYAKAAADKIVAGATKAWTIAQWALNAAWAASPIGVIVAIVLALAAAIYIAYQRSATFRKIVDAMWKGIQAGARITLNVVRVVWNAILASGRAVAAALGAVWRAIMAAISAYVRAYLAVFQAAFNTIRRVGSSVASAVQGAWNGVRNAIGRAVDAVQSLANWFGRLHVPSLSGSVFDTIASAINRAISAVKSLIGWLGRIKVPKISLPKIPGLRSLAAPAATGPATFAAGEPTARGLTAAPAALRSLTPSGAAVVINITGAVDPESTARQVRRLLNGFDVRHSTPDNRRGLRTV